MFLQLLFHADVDVTMYGDDNSREYGRFNMISQFLFGSIEQVLCNIRAFSEVPSEAFPNGDANLQ